MNSLSDHTDPGGRHPGRRHAAPAMCTRAILLPFAAAWLFAPAAACGQDRAADAGARGREAPPAVTLPHTEVRHLSSEHVGVEYKLYVSVPKSYARGDRAYRVVYMLDADYSFALARNIVEHLSDRGDMPEMILVAIAYAGPLRYRLNRTRDYTPTHTLEGGYGPEYQRVSGGGPNFLRFLREELIPFVDATYRTLDERTFVGHSYGGLFGSWVLVTQPSTFSSYIIVSPSLWYDDGVIFRIEREYAAGRKELPIAVYMSVGSHEVNGRWNMVADLNRFARTIRGRGYRGLLLHSRVFEDETHNSIFPTGLSRGLRFLYGTRSWDRAWRARSTAGAAR